VAQEGRRTQVALFLEQDVVEDVVDVDQEAAGHQTGRQGGASRAGIYRRAGDRRGDEMPAGTHVVMSVATTVPV